MMTLAAPLGLLALLALAVPLLVHLWRPPPRTVRVGSLRFLRDSTRPPVRHLRWREYLRLLLRLTLFSLLTLLLARPLWYRSLGAGTKWALRSPTAQLSAEAAESWRALLREGYEERWLAPGFPTSRPANASAPVDAWSLLAEADARLPENGALAVAAPTTLATLRSARPELSRPVRWIAADSPVLERPPVPSPVRPLRVILRAAADRAEDARVVEAALRALAASNTVALELGETAEPDWIVALGDVKLREVRARVLRDAETVSPAPAGTSFAGGRLRERHAPVFEGAVLERDSRGDAILTDLFIDGYRCLRLQTRFRPASMEATESSALPAWLGRILAPPDRDVPNQDVRITSLGQAQPAVRAEMPRPRLPEPLPADLTGLLWMATLLLFAAERIWSLQR